jgi:hypothetical protein
MVQAQQDGEALFAVVDLETTGFSPLVGTGSSRSPSSE